MFDKELVGEILSQILTAARRIERRCRNIFEPDDFLVSDEGIDKLESGSVLKIMNSVFRRMIKHYKAELFT